MPRQTMVSFEIDPVALRLVEQRARQEGVSRSAYLRECVYLDFILSGDLEATKFIAKRIGNRVKDALVDKIKGTDITAQMQRLELRE